MESLHIFKYFACNLQNPKVYKKYVLSDILWRSKASEPRAFHVALAWWHSVVEQILQRQPPFPHLDGQSWKRANEKPRRRYYTNRPKVLARRLTSLETAIVLHKVSTVNRLAHRTLKKKRKWEWMKMWFLVTLPHIFDYYNQKQLTVDLSTQFSPGWQPRFWQVSLAGLAIFGKWLPERAKLVHTGNWKLRCLKKNVSVQLFPYNYER